MSSPTVRDAVQRGRAMGSEFVATYDLHKRPIAELVREGIETGNDLILRRLADTDRVVRAWRESSGDERQLLDEETTIAFATYADTMLTEAMQYVRRACQTTLER